MITDLNRIDEILNGSESGFFNCDCMELMKMLPDKSIQLLHADPPYGINADSYRNGEGMKDHAKNSTSRRVEKERSGRLRGCGQLKGRILNSLNCSWDFEPPNPDYFMEAFRVSQNQIIWGGELLLICVTPYTGRDGHIQSRSAADQGDHSVGQNAAVGELFTIRTGMDIL